MTTHGAVLSLLLLAVATCGVDSAGWAEQYVPDCTKCGDEGSPMMQNYTLECAKWTRGLQLHCNNSQEWSENKFCQESCYFAGHGYPGDVCCKRTRPPLTFPPPAPPQCPPPLPLVPPRPPPSFPPQADRCVFVANLHVSKCGGTSLRALLQEMSAREGARWRQSRREGDNGGYCEDLPLHTARVASLPNGKYWAEMHCNQDIVQFNRGVEELREALAPRGCHVVSTVLLRDPVKQAVSHWQHFCAAEWDGTGGGGSECAREAELAQDVKHWAAMNPETELSLLLMRSHVLPGGENITALFSPRAGGAAVSQQQLDSACSVASKLAVSELGKIDVVGAVGTAGGLKAFWKALAEKAFPKQGDYEMLSMDLQQESGHSNLFEDSAVGKATLRQNPGFRLRHERMQNSTGAREAERQAILQYNKCSAGVFHTAMRHFVVGPGHAHPMSG